MEDHGCAVAVSRRADGLPHRTEVFNIASCHETYPPFEVTVQRDDAVATVVVSGEFDMATAPSSTVAEQGDARLLVLDLTAVTFIDSTGVRVLIEADPEPPAPARAHASWCWPATGRYAEFWTSANSTAGWRWSRTIPLPPPSAWR